MGNDQYVCQMCVVPVLLAFGHYPSSGFGLVGRNELVFLHEVPMESSYGFM